MFNFFASIILAIAVITALGTQLATAAYRNTLITHCADCRLPDRGLG